MKSLYATAPQQPQVTAIFADGAQSFFLSQGATLAELADLVDGLGVLHIGAPIGIRVRFDKSGSRRGKSAPSRPDE